MLKRIYSDLPSFKTVIFHSGLNIVLATKSGNSSDKKTRNGAGKSSLVELINSLLASDLRKNNSLKSKLLQPYRFGLEIDLPVGLFAVERSGDTPGKIYIVKAPSGVLSTKESGFSHFISCEAWASLLGAQFFSLDGSLREVRNSPSFRALFSYFARSMKGFDSPEKVFPQQSTGNIQVALTYLLKLDWTLAGEFEVVRQKDKLIKALKKASNEGSLSEIIGSASDLRTQLVLKGKLLERLKGALSTFRVLPEYEEKERRASEISRQLATLSGIDTTELDWLAQLANILEIEAAPDISKVERLFAEATTDLPEVVSRRFDEVARFHESVTNNRKDHLRQEIEGIKSRIEERRMEKQKLDEERASIMSLLQSHGALDEYMKMHGSVSKLEAEVELLEKKLNATESLNEKTHDLKIERHNIQRKMRIDHAEREKIIREAIITFAEISSGLYDEPGKLVVDPTENGPVFDFDIPGKKSTGKTKMQIFCFDMTMMKLWAGESSRPDVLVHDSIIFDGVDERQKAKALIIGAAMAEKYNFQYIVTMNSDDMPDMSGYSEFKLENYRVELNITDTPTGGLFGLRFD